MGRLDLLCRENYSLVDNMWLLAGPVAFCLTKEDRGQWKMVKCFGSLFNLFLFDPQNHGITYLHNSKRGHVDKVSCSCLLCVSTFRPCALLRSLFLDSQCKWRFSHTCWTVLDCVWQWCIWFLKEESQLEVKCGDVPLMSLFLPDLLHFSWSSDAQLTQLSHSYLSE